ncbi:hypothetical protein [Ectopseudomonas khazarica]
MSLRDDGARYAQAKPDNGDHQMSYEPEQRNMADIEVTAYNSDRYRLPRLHHTVGYAAAMMSVNGVGQLPLRVSGVHDHKGILQVHWLTVPAEIEKHAFKLAWVDVGDGTDMVEHFLDGDLIG